MVTHGSVQCKDIAIVELRSLQPSLMDSQTVRILISKGSRAFHMVPKKLTAQQSEPQRADLNEHVNLLATHHAQYSVTLWACAASISRQSALIA